MFTEFLDTHDLKAMLLPMEQRLPFPRLGDRQAWNALPQRAQLLIWGEEAWQGYPMLTATQFLAYVRTGDRKAYENPYFERRFKLMGAVLAECAADDGRYLDAVIDGLWCVCEETTWVLSAHNGSSHPGMRPACERPLPNADDPYIDLFAAQTCATLCYMLYFLKDKLDGVSPLVARRVRREIERRIFLPFMTRDDFWWMGMIRRDVNNWTPWILSNLIDSMLLMVDDQLRLAEGLERAMRMLDSYLAVMPPDGGCDEGSSYWNMAGASLLDCLESLGLATGGAVDFYGEPLIKHIGAFAERAYIGNGYYWNFADCDAKPMMDGERMHRYGLRTGNARLETLGLRTLCAHSGVKPPDTPQMSRVLMTLFASPAPIAPPVPIHMDTRVDLPWLGVYAWRSNGLYLAAKAGHNGESHNHNDVGSFILYADDEPQIVDAGNMTYTAKTFGPERYTLWNTRSRNHNLPLIDGVEQQAGVEFRARDVRLRENEVTMELSAAYPSEAGLEGFERRFALEGSCIALIDRIRLSAAKPVTWVFMLRSEPVIEAGRIRFGKLEMRHDLGLQANTEEIPVTDERMARSFPGSLWRLSLTTLTNVSHEQSFLLVRS